MSFLIFFFFFIMIMIFQLSSQIKFVIWHSITCFFSGRRRRNNNKGIVHPTMKILSLITPPHVVPNPWDLCSSSEQKLRYFWWSLRAMRILFVHKENNNNNLFSNSSPRITFFIRFCVLIMVISLLSMEDQRTLRFHQKYLHLCSEDERRSYGFGTTWAWVINDRIFIFGWINPLIWKTITYSLFHEDGTDLDNE